MAFQSQEERNTNMEALLGDEIYIKCMYFQ